jgi:outer membrane receptor protein involved in Fe transport
VICALAAWLLLAAAAAAAAGRQQEKPAFLGLSLTAALQLLQARGLPVFFSSSVVRDSMRVETEPRGSSPREVLDEILQPHGLRAEEVRAGRLIVVAAPPAPAQGRRATVQDRPPAVEREPLPVMTEEIFVTPGRNGQEGLIGSLSIGSAEAGMLPHLGDDPFRAAGLLSGAASSEASSRIHVHGGRDDEVLIVLDGLELLAPYHLQDYDSALSIVASTVVDRIELSTGGYPAEYGDRMSGVLDMTTLTPPRARRFALGLGILYGDASASGALSGDRGRWYFGGRSGTYHLALEVNGREESPRYWDTFGKLELSLRPDQTLQLNALAAEDELYVAASEPGGERYQSYWGNRYLWLTHGAVPTPDLFIETIASAGRIDRARSGSAADSEARFELRDHRLLDLFGLKHAWRFQPGERRSLEGGVELRRLRSTFDYRSDHDLADPLATLRPQPPKGSTSLQERLDYDQAAAFVSSRLRPVEALTAELGARLDHNGFTGESHVSPRLNLAWKPSEGNVFRLAWGWFYQSQRPNELQIGDGETELARAERAEHRILGFEHRRGSGAAFRVETYQRRLIRPRTRFENLFDPVTLFPELSGARVRIAPDGGLTQGIDLFVRGADRGPLSWWLAYSYSSIEDRLGGRLVPRGVDQPHALRADLDYRTQGGWSFNAAWLYHTGWPTTEVTARVVPASDGSSRIEPVLGPLHGERLPAYHRLDFRVSRAWKVPLGELSTYLDLQNLYDRENVRGFDNFAFEIGQTGEPRVHSEAVSWGEFLPSFGIRWQL